MGRALTFVAPVFAVGVVYSLYSSWHWSEGELRTAVHQAADALNARPRYVNPGAPQDGLVRDTVEEAGTGPGHGLSVGGNGTDGYTISTQDTAAAFCMHLTLTPVDPGRPFPAALERHHVKATVTEGTCRHP
ncbi:hypothetical protein [Streptomyces yangpuensis]|uniref:hypothetical protein n=1 Tax=Streptomyces yangpuensis TaxID=1648182 RepID=UPI00380CC52A